MNKNFLYVCVYIGRTLRNLETDCTLSLLLQYRIKVH
jgi:hypothetical protein